MKNIRVFLSEKFRFSEVKFSIYLNRRVFVMMTIKPVFGHAKYKRPDRVYRFSLVKVVSLTIQYLEHALWIHFQGNILSASLLERVLL